MFFQNRINAKAVTNFVFRCVSFLSIVNDVAMRAKNLMLRAFKRGADSSETYKSAA